MEHETPSVFPGNFRKRKVLGTHCFPFCLPEKLVQANLYLVDSWDAEKELWERRERFLAIPNEIRAPNEG